MQHMFSPIPHIAAAIEVYVVSDSSYYDALRLLEGTPITEQLMATTETRKLISKLL